MTEDEARGWAAARVGPDVMTRLATFVAMVVAENAEQNLISPASIGSIWSRHVVDSLQLRFLVEPNGRWLDIGSGGGFPGVVLAISGIRPMLLVEPRRRRAEFLQRCVDRLDLSSTTIVGRKVEAVTATADIISARAVGSIENLLRVARHCATPSTQWLLPRGGIDEPALARVAQNAGMMFHVEHSVTRAGSKIVVMGAR